MIITVTPNTAVDKTLTVHNFQTGFRHRATESLTLPGGKGVSIARAAKELGQPVIVTGLVGGRAGQLIVEGLQRETSSTTSSTSPANRVRPPPSWTPPP